MIVKKFKFVLGFASLKIKRRFPVKKSFIIMLAALMVTAIGCQKKEDAGKASLPQPAAETAASKAGAPNVAAPQAAPAAAQPAVAQKPAAPPAGDPHAAFKGRELPAAAAGGHKGKVLQVMDAGSYTYLEVEEKGQKLWVAALKAKVTKGQTVEFPDSKPMENFEIMAVHRRLVVRIRHWEKLVVQMQCAVLIWR